MLQAEVAVTIADRPTRDALCEDVAPATHERQLPALHLVEDVGRDDAGAGLAQSVEILGDVPFDESRVAVTHDGRPGGRAGVEGRHRFRDELDRSWRQP